ncbi:hypothetical protein [Chitinophaga terrae (ex Kim and Jung 2007)]|nr:hypothetical protein [Chitinophaga terrae (ex Kim and Jung 2007)]GEP92998.1 hypothetical protein CTE07_46430 [Chitinophaga terrae (ex Kim and Jung 2007)]
MPDTYNIVWNGNAVGEIELMSRDMWYLEGKYILSGTEISTEFEKRLRDGDMKAFQQDPETNSLKVILHNTENADLVLYCLAIYIDDNVINLRQLASSEAIDKFFHKPKYPRILSFILSIFNPKL